MGVVNEMEHAGLVDAIIKAARGQNVDGTAFNGGHVDVVDIIRQVSPKISQLRDDAVAAELDDQSAALWEAAKWLESTYEVLNENGDEQAAAIVHGQMKVLQDVSGKLSRRAATVRGVSAEELAARGVLHLPAEIPALQEETVRSRGWLVTCTLCGTREVVEVDGDVNALEAWRDKHVCPPPAGEMKAMLFLRCQRCGLSATLQAPVEEHEQRRNAWADEHEPQCPGSKEIPAE